MILVLCADKGEETMFKGIWDMIKGKAPARDEERDRMVKAMDAFNVTQVENFPYKTPEEKRELRGPTQRGTQDDDPIPEFPRLASFIDSHPPPNRALHS